MTKHISCILKGQARKQIQRKCEQGESDSEEEQEQLGCNMTGDDDKGKHNVRHAVHSVSRDQSPRLCITNVLNWT